MKGAWAHSRGFTIVELLIVIVVIAILAAITVVAYNGIQEQARMSKITADLDALEKAILLARTPTSGVLQTITGSWGTGGPCASKAGGTDLAALPKSDNCWVNYTNTLNAISNASGMNVRGLVDPWGRPYVIDENETEAGPTHCVKDHIGAYQIPLNGWNRMAGTNIQIPNIAPACL